MTTDREIAEKVSQYLVAGPLSKDQFATQRSQLLPVAVQTEGTIDVIDWREWWDKLVAVGKKVICTSPTYDTLIGLTAAQIAAQIDTILKIIVALVMKEVPAWVSQFVDWFANIIANVLHDAVHTSLPKFCARPA